MISKPVFETAKPLYQQVEEYLRGQIQQGILAPRAKLPPTEELARAWGIGNSAVHKAMSRLVADGLIQRKPRFGSFVQPDSARAVIAVLVGPSLLDETAHSYRAVLKFIQSDILAMKERRWECRVYDDLVNLAANPDFKKTSFFRKITGDFRNPLFKGIIELDAGLSDLLGVKQKFEPFTVRPGPDFVTDYYGFGRESVEYLATRGIKNIVYLKTTKFTADLEGIHTAVRDFALPEPEIYRIHATKGGQLLEQAAHDIVLQLCKSGKFSKNRANALQALLVSDDIATRGVATALLSQGIKVPDQALVLTWANKEIVHHYGIPVIKYAFSTRDIARTFLAILHAKLNGAKPSEQPVIIHGRIKEK
ncbi:MAG: GntR family transcriptional regulator [Verrucomicrobia bacterium]|nr:GntR family transcriptional regulator [Verrucomicrobiota bacterium]MBU1735194.1 GntR family transcriptional regulator [Verrucomicrobiota bacterium]MBU1855820.1 GntR family transcriptional regulator [Verrucomicrobiota bacterium]